MDEQRILVGRFGAPHGVRGALRLKSFTGDPAAIARYAPLLDASGTRRFTIKTLRPVKADLFVACVVGVDTRAQAAALTNMELFVPRDALPAAERDEFYLADLIGLAAISAEGASLGRVVDVLNYGGGDILEIAPAGGGDTLLLPFSKHVVLEIDVAAGRLTVALPIEIEGQGEGEADAPGK